MRSKVEEAMRQLLRSIKTKNDTFLVLSSLNLLNFAVKQKEFKGEFGYGLIKPAVAKIVKICFENIDKHLVDEIYYNVKEQCVYIRCYGIQFSFHNVGAKLIGEEFITSSLNKRVGWDGIRLQPIALELFSLAKECYEKNIFKDQVILERFKSLLDCE